MLNDVKFKLVGAAPLLMHNSRLSDPLDMAEEVIRLRDERDALKARLENEGA